MLVYIREAHALDSAAPKSFLEIEDPINWEERQDVCSDCIDDLELPMPAVVDQLDDRVNQAYGAHPDRLYLVGKDGKIAYAGAKGPSGFKPDELERAIQRELAGKPPLAAQAPDAAQTARPGPIRPGVPARRDPAMMFQRFDADHDGKLTKDEVPPFMLQRWARMDVNGDGVVDEAEQAAVIERIRRSGARP